MKRQFFEMMAVPALWFTAAGLIIITSFDHLTIFATQSIHKQQAQSNNHRNVSELLDNLLRGYDNSIRPDFGGKRKSNAVHYCLTMGTKHLENRWRKKIQFK
ncbi:hypothetical protein C0J52_10598 [Blattella germanica]|nr:hypothetical protein C0J52_10598 [Blattella germanica]